MMPCNDLTKITMRTGRVQTQNTKPTLAQMATMPGSGTITKGILFEVMRNSPEGIKFDYPCSSAGRKGWLQIGGTLGTIGPRSPAAPR